MACMIDFSHENLADFIELRVVDGVVFGGAHGPERFCSVASFPRQVAERRIADLQRRHPPPPGVIARCAARAALQERGLLRAGVEQAGEKLVQAAASDVALLAHRVPELEEEKIEAQKKQWDLEEVAHVPSHSMHAIA